MVLRRAEEYVYSDYFLRDWILSTMIIVLTMILTAALYPVISESTIGTIIRDQLKQILESAEPGGLNPISLMILIILNNIRVALIMALSSPTLLLPLGLEAFQGAAVGYMISAILHGDYPVSIETVNLGPLTIHYGLAPHGVVEIPAISLVIAPLVGVRRYGLRRAVSYSLAMLPLTVSMLVIAGVVESTVTIVLMLLIIALKILVS